MEDDDFVLDDIADDDDDLDNSIGDDADLGFSEDVQASRANEYEREFVVHTVSEVEGLLQKQVDQVTSVLGLQSREALPLLRAARWRPERLFEQYMENPEPLVTAAGVSLGFSGPTPTKLPGFVCDVCCMDDPKMDTVALACGHRFCLDCYRQYVASKVQDGEFVVRCMASKCNLILDDVSIKTVAEPAIYAKYKRLLTQSYVDDQDFLRWCPAPGCEYIIECHASMAHVVPAVTCRCGNRFCFGCGAQDHMPATCLIVKEWLKKCADDSETANWISVHTKECPKCHTTIEKNGGCNHMHCKKCKHEFCWVCQGPWSDHGSSWYNCNRFDDKASEDARGAQAKSRAALERYLHYYTRYQNHDNSAKLDQQVYSRVEAQMARMQKETEMSWIEVQFLKRAADVLFQCRMTLKWTYAFAYYLRRSNMTDIFESNQRDLELAVEQLSGFLESDFAVEDIPRLRQNIIDKTVYVSHRREVLLNDTAKGFEEDRWQFVTNNDILTSSFGTAGGSSSSSSSSSAKRG